jgi:chaperone modulatory protein CbpM
VEAEITEVSWIEDGVEWTVAELAARSRFTEAELRELLDCGALPRGGQRVLPALRAAARLRSDFELDLHGVALALTLLNRIEELEADLSRLRPLAR